jgi:hypothetical protein
MSFRKRKTAAPFFRLPNPTDPVSGKSNYLYPPLKQYTRFTLLEALTITDEYADAEITSADQWGQNPIFHPPEIHIYVHNQLSDNNQTYVFTGATGDVGIALHDYENHWRIIAMISGGLRGGCLAEDHTGRGEPFDIHLGTWDAAQDKWVYDTENTAVAIDWRYDVPQPDEGATGLFEARASDTYGVIYECVALDCSSPGECGD